MDLGPKKMRGKAPLQPPSPPLMRARATSRGPYAASMASSISTFDFSVSDIHSASVMHSHVSPPPPEGVLTCSLPSPMVFLLPLFPLATSFPSFDIPLSLSRGLNLVCQINLRRIQLSICLVLDSCLFLTI